MLKSLYVENGFKHHKKKWTFGEGLTAITGKNEAGKSLILEFIRFGLFGSKALRGAASDYKKLVVELEFEVRSKAYKVVRNPSRTSLHEGKEMIATGTTAVNAKIIEILGYGLIVFDVANACLQGSVEALGTMKPTDRRKMVDDTVGLNVIDDLITYTKEQASVYRGKIEALEGNLTPPPLPDEVIAETSAELLVLVQQAEADVTELNKLRGRLHAAQVANAPQEEPVRPRNYLPEADRRHTQTVLSRRYYIGNLLRGLPEGPSQTEDELEAMLAEWAASDLWEAVNREFEALPPKPALNPDEIAKESVRVGEYLTWKRYAHLWSQHKIECPKCEHQFAAGVSDPGPWEGEEPKYREAELDAMLRAWTKLENFDKKYGTLGPKPKAPALSKAEIAQAKTALKAQGQRQALLAELNDLPVVGENFEEDRDASAHYDQQYAAWQNADKVAPLWDRINELGPKDAELIELRRKYTERRVYEAAVKAYDDAMKALDVRKAELDEVKVELEDHKNAAKALTELKVKIKQHLLPALAKRASKLLKSMTGGERHLIEIDDAFNIVVDGQPITTLSGSAKAAANLSVRIGLGQVLTNKVFSVLLADEVDAAMDADRAEHTAASLRALTSEISQIILISHKRPEADTYVEL